MTVEDKPIATRRASACLTPWASKAPPRKTITRAVIGCAAGSLGPGKEQLRLTLVGLLRSDPP